MTSHIVKQSGGAWKMRAYDIACREFTWQQARTDLQGLPGGHGLNIAHEALDRHLGTSAAECTALRWLSKDGEVCELTYRALAELSNRFANVLGALGVERGDSVFVLAGRTPELYISVLGALKFGAVLCPLFSAFGPEPIETRLRKGRGRVLVTTQWLYRRKVEALRDNLPELRHVLLLDGQAAGTLSYDAQMHRASGRFQIPPTDPQQPALLHFTSGTTGSPKGALHVHEAVVAHRATGSMALDLREGDVYWCTADPGWVTGISYGLIAPLTCGATLFVDAADFDASRWYRNLAHQRIQVWYTAPTAVRMLMRYGEDARQGLTFPNLRHIASVGEPLNAEAVLWGKEVFGIPFHDTWWQSETGAIMIANYPSMEVKPGSMGRPFPGIDARLARRGTDGRVELVEEAGRDGEIVLRKGWPSMFRAYLDEPDRYAKCFSGDWYFTGDLATRDAEGYFNFVGRADDVITTAGHLIGPFEVESALMEHRAVAEAGAIGVPDEYAGQVVKAFVVLKRDVAASPALNRELLAYARQRLGPAVAPRAIEFRADLPKNRSGKIMRRLLRARELGLPEGDTSTLEVDG